jgi:hypothetical protein
MASSTFDQTMLDDARRLIEHLRQLPVEHQDAARHAIGSLIIIIDNILGIEKPIWTAPPEITFGGIVNCFAQRVDSLATNTAVSGFVVFLLDQQMTDLLMWILNTTESTTTTTSTSTSTSTSTASTST